MYGDEKKCYQLFREIIKIGGLDQPTTIYTNGISVKFMLFYTREGYSSAEYNCVFSLTRQLPSLYQAALGYYIDHPVDIKRLNCDIMDDLLRLQPLFAVRIMFKN
jgi:hypothetical protein